MNRGPNGKHWTQHKWTYQDKAYLVNHYQTDGPTKCSKELGIPRPSIQHQAKLLGLTQQAKPWTKEDIEFLEQNCTSMTQAEMAELLDRTTAAVAAKLHSLYHDENSTAKSRVRSWTAADTKKLKKLHSKNLSTNEIARQMNRGSATIKRHMDMLNLQQNVEPSKPWTSNDFQYLKDNYAKLGGRACAEHLNRTLMSIQKQACRLKLTNPPQKPQENEVPTCEEN